MKTLLKLNFVLVMIMLYMVNIYGNTLVLDDFNTGAAQNFFGGVNDVWYNNATINAFYYANPDKILGRTGYSLKLIYDISGGHDYYGGYYMKLNDKDISQYNYLSFWVRSDSGNDSLKIEIKCSTNVIIPDVQNKWKAEIYTTDYLDSGITTAWQKVMIPMDVCLSLYQMTNMYELTFTLENSAALRSGSPVSGVIYIDDIVFGTWEPGFVRVDHYGDKNSVCGLGGNIGSGTNVFTAWITNSFSSSDFYSHANALKIDYDLSGGNNDWCYCWHIFGGGGDKNVEIECDFSKYTNLTFWAKSTNKNIYGSGGHGTHGAEHPWNGMKVELGNDVKTYFTYTTTISNVWQKFSFQLSKFQFFDGEGDFLDKSRIKKLVFTFEHVTGSSTLLDDDLVGTVFIDNVQFEGAGYTPDTTSPAIPTLLKNGDDVVTNGYAFDVTNTLYVQADTGTLDESIEGVIFEYSLDNGSTWYRIGTDYDTSDVQYSVEWDTTDIENSSECQIQVYSMDASGNVSGKLIYNIVIEDLSASTTLTKPAQKILTPNNDGINDYLNFTGLGSDFEISIFNLKGKLIKKITDKSYWDGKNDKGNIVEGGIYIYIVKRGDDRIDGTIVVVK